MRSRVVLGLLSAMLAISPLHAQGVSVSLRVNMKPNPEAHRAAAMKMPAVPSQVVAWLTPINAEPAVHSSRSFTLIQKDKQFTPHLLVVPTGASVEFPNLDPFFHNVFSLYDGRRFDLGLYEAGSHHSVRFDHEGISYIFCNIHPEMGAVVIALSTPYYTLSDKDGLLLLLNVPPGDYDLNLWSENVARADLASAHQRLHVGQQNLHLPPISLNQAPSVLDQHLDKFGEHYKSSEETPY